MGRIAETDLGIDIHNFLLTGFHQFICFSEALLDKPFFRGKVTYLLEITLECGETPAGIMSNFLDAIELVPGLADGREKQVVLTEKGIAYSSGILTPLRELEHRVYQIMGSGQVQQMVDQITLFNTVLEKEMEKDM